MYLLDVTSMVEVKNVTNCQIFIGEARTLEKLRQYLRPKLCGRRHGSAIEAFSFAAYHVQEYSLRDASVLHLGHGQHVRRDKPNASGLITADCPEEGSVDHGTETRQHNFFVQGLWTELPSLKTSRAHA